MTPVNLSKATDDNGANEEALAASPKFNMDLVDEVNYGQTAN